jgi:hypothetical protein
LFTTGKEGTRSGGVNFLWKPKNLFRGVFSSFLFLFLFYIENNNKGNPEGKTTIPISQKPFSTGNLLTYLAKNRQSKPNWASLIEFTASNVL